MTNGDKIRSMTDEELWVLTFKVQRCAYCRLVDDCDGTIEKCKKIGMEWLKSECEDEFVDGDTMLMNDFVRDEIDRYEPGLDGM